MNRYNVLRFLVGSRRSMSTLTTPGMSGFVLSTAIIFSFAIAARPPPTSAPANEPAPAAPRPNPRNRGPVPRRKPQTVIMVGAGDIAGCKNLEGAQATAKLVEQF